MVCAFQSELENAVTVSPEPAVGTAEPLITLAKNDTLMRRRLAYSRLGNKNAVKKLFEVLGPRFKSRPGGYMRILKKGHKLGDASPIAYVLLSE